MTTKKTDAWMPFWIGDYLADTMTLTRDQHGGYFLLLLAYWRNHGPLPDDDEELAAIVKASPDEWVKLRPKLAKFFTVADGRWTHGRADKELSEASERREAATKKAQAGARAKWEKAHAACSSTASSNASSTAPSTAQALPEQCPSPSPSPVGGIAIAIPPPEPAAPSGVTHIDGEYVGPSDPLPGVAYGATARPIRAAGMADADPGHPTFRTLVDAGATAEEFLAFVPEALKKARPWPWLIAAVVGERERAKATGGKIHQGPLVVATAAKTADTAAQADVQRTQELLAAQAAVTSSPEAREAAMAKMRKTRAEMGVA